MMQNKEEEQAVQAFSVKPRARELHLMVGMSQESTDKAGMGQDTIDKWREELAALVPQPPAGRGEVVCICPPHVSSKMAASA